MAKFQLTDKFCRDVEFPEQGQKLYFDAHKDAPNGFALRVTKNEKRFILNYYVRGAQRRITLDQGFPTWGPARARLEANKTRTAINAGGDPLADRERRIREQAARDESDAAKRDQTLGSLLTAYADQLKAESKPSAAEARRLFDSHVKEAHPRLWKLPAADVQPEDGVSILKTLRDAQKLRTAGKLRSYLRAAYAAAVRARLDADSSDALRAFRLRANPLTDLPTLKGGSGGARERALSISELRAYWKRIKGMDDADGAALRFHLLTGGQRIDQLARVTAGDHDKDSAFILLRDIKGRRREPRMHVVPLIPAAIEAISAMQGRRGSYVFSVDGGKTGAAYHEIHHRLRPIVAAMSAAGELENGSFTPGDLRRTVETRLSALGISREVRAQLQSHGLGGVQTRHYDRHDYLAEKRDALEQLYRLVRGENGSVTSINKGRRKPA